MVVSHLTSTRLFLDHLHSRHLEQECVVEFLDASSPYTNVQNDALQTLSEMLDRHQNSINNSVLSKAYIVTLIKECPGCNVFKWTGRYCYKYEV